MELLSTLFTCHSIDGQEMCWGTSTLLTIRLLAFSDVIIKFGDKQVFAHKDMPASASIWFERALLGNFSVSLSFFRAYSVY
jgi:hypothetical protein